jgi:uncharacterized membrane protein
LARSGPGKSQVQPAVRQEVSSVQYSYSGPLPHPDILQQYDRIVPNGAERIFAQFESQSAHRRMIEAKVINSNSFVQIFGAISALLLGGLVFCPRNTRT